MPVTSASVRSTRQLVLSLARCRLAPQGQASAAARALHASVRPSAAGPSRAAYTVSTSQTSPPSASVVSALDELPWFSESEAPAPTQEVVPRAASSADGLPGASAGRASANPVPALDELPWFTQDAHDGVHVSHEEILPVSASEFRDGGVYDRIPRPSILSGMDVPSTEALQYILPGQLDDLYDILICGPASHLVAPLALSPPAGSESNTTASSSPSASRPSIRFIHAPSLASDAESRTKADWVVVVESRTSNPDDVRRLAQEIGRYLAHTAPPETARGFSEEFQDSLSPPKHTRGDMLQALGDMFRNPVGHYYKGDGRRPDEEAEPKEQTGKAWRPTRMLSRQTQDGMRMLHKADPEMFTVQQLAQAFHVSEIAVRKILRSKWRPSPEEAQKQERRRLNRAKLHREAGPEAHRLVLQRLQAALVKQRNMPLSADSSLLGDALTSGYDVHTKNLVESIRQHSRRDAMNKVHARSAKSPPSTCSREPKPMQHVEFHGLEQRGDKQSAVFAPPTGGQSPHGSWAMVDASWCQVHIVAPNMRPRLVDEQQWEARAARVMHHSLDGLPDSVLPPSQLQPQPGPGPDLEATTTTTATHTAPPKQVFGPVRRSRKSSARGANGSRDQAKRTTTKSE